jgi:tetratricopeptide (TPR) repeat protein
LIGQTLQERYRLEAEIGRGAMGVVYRAHDTVLDRAVAVKLLSAQAPNEDTLARWRHEAQAAAKLQHPNIVAVFDAGASGGTPFIVMELVDGTPLGRDPERPIAETIALARQLCAALGHAHAHGIVHRDLKPENVLIRQEAGTVQAKLTDLGVARLSHSTQLTKEGTLIGTASYFAPEQALGLVADGRADLYALGVLLYELVTDRLPFDGDDPLAVISQHLHAPVVPPRTYRKDLPEALEAIIVRCLAKDREQRFATAEDIDAALIAVPAGGALGPAASGPQDVEGVRLDGLARGRMTGRRGEMAQLRDLWDHAQGGHSHMALVSGEPGVGKTRLAHEVIVLASLQGATVLRGGCYEFEATTPYLPWVEGLRQWVGEQSPDALRASLGDTAPELARFAPEIEAKLGPQPPAPNVGEQQERLRLFDALARFLQTLAARKGLLVFLDDLHWADHGTLQLLHYVLRNMREDPMLVLGCYREIELDRSHPLSAALVEWNRERLATRIPLARLSLEDTERMLATMFSQQSVSADFAVAIHRETEGNPFFVEEVVKSLIENGQIYREDNRWQRKDVAELTIPQSIKAAIGRRLNRLSESTTTMLHTAAALGKIFEFETLVAVSDAGEDALLDALDEATAAQLVRVESGERFAFTHDKIREVLHEELNPIRQRRLHQRIAESLERLQTTRPGDFVEDLAYHFAQGSDLEKGLTYSLAAAAQARKVYAHEEALEHLERARDCAEALEDTSRLATIEMEIADVHDSRGEPQRSAEHGERALALTTDARARGAIRARLGAFYVTVGDARGREHLEKALQELDPESQKLDVARALMAIGRYEHLKGRHASSVDHLTRAREMVRPPDDPHLLVMVLTYLAGAFQHSVEFDKSIAFAREAIEVGEQYQLPLGVAGGWEFIAEDSYLMGRPREALHAAEMDRSVGERAGAIDRVAWANFAFMHSHRILGELDLAVEAARRCLALAHRLGETRLESVAGSGLAFALFERGDLDEALEQARTSCALADAGGQLYPRVDTRLVLGMVKIRSGDHAGGAADILAIEAYLEGSDNRGVALLWAAWGATALVEAGDATGAGHLLECARPIAETAGSQLYDSRIRAAEAGLLALRGDGDAARASFDATIELLEQMEARQLLGRALIGRAKVRLETGDGVGAQRDRARAIELFEACGARLDLDKVRSPSGTPSSS